MAAEIAAVSSGRHILESVARQLLVVEHRPNGAFITTPLMYPSGSLVLVRVDALGRDRYFVTDMGNGYLEAEMMGYSLIFGRNAKSVAEQAGHHFDHHVISIMDIAQDQLPGAIISIANASLQAVTLTAYKHSEKRVAEEAELLYERLVKVFTRQHVSRDVPLIGASDTRWRVSNVVRIEQKTTVFEPVSNHANSVTTAATKFHDLARLEDPPNCVAVVEDKVKLRTYLGVLSQAANVISRDASDATIKRLAA